MWDPLKRLHVTATGSLFLLPAHHFSSFILIVYFSFVSLFVLFKFYIYALFNLNVILAFLSNSSPSFLSFIPVIISLYNCTLINCRLPVSSLILSANNSQLSLYLLLYFYIVYFCPSFSYPSVSRHIYSLISLLHRTQTRSYHLLKCVGNLLIANCAKLTLLTIFNKYIH